MESRTILVHPGRAIPLRKDVERNHQIGQPMWLARNQRRNPLNEPVADNLFYEWVVSNGGYGSIGKRDRELEALRMLSIETPLGRMRGAEHNGCLAFRGIRYAKAPVGALRFRPPEPVESWSALYDATEFGPSAPQPAMFMPGDPLQLPTEPTDEDWPLPECLYSRG